MEYFEVQLKSAIAAKGWVAGVSVGGGGGGGGGDAAAAPAYMGVRGQLAAAEKRRQEAAAKIDQAFDGNLKGLMAEAQSLVRLASQCNAKINKGGASTKEVDEFRDYLLSMGIADPVTRSKQSGGGSNSVFHTELARELGEFLTIPLERGNGMVLLHDVYCLYNRARKGIELISPTDLMEACAHFDQLGIPMTLHEFKSKVKVIRYSSLNDDAVAEQVGTFVADNGATSPSQLAQSQGISVTLAREQLLTAEELGKLCRDDTIDCMRFYPNRFLQEE